MKVESEPGPAPRATSSSAEPQEEPAEIFPAFSAAHYQLHSSPGCFQHSHLRFWIQPAQQSQVQGAGDEPEGFTLSPPRRAGTPVTFTWECTCGFPAKVC
jgi:hypothetical protein